jgi:CBS domain-containing protein
MLVKEVMTPAPNCCRPTDRIDTVAKLMLELDCGSVPVMDGRKLVGMITDRDITCRVVATGKTPMAIAVRDVMTKTVHTIRDDEQVEAAINLMKTRQVRRVPVLDSEGNLVGIVSPSDLAPIFASTNVADFLLSVSYWNHRTAIPAN